MTSYILSDPVGSGFPPHLDSIPSTFDLLTFPTEEIEVVYSLGTDSCLGAVVLRGDAIRKNSAYEYVRDGAANLRLHKRHYVAAAANAVMAPELVSVELARGREY